MTSTLLSTRNHGTEGPLVVLVHGGPGAPGSLGPVGEQLGSTCRAIEPFQRTSGQAPLSVAQHVADMQRLVESLDERPLILGHSWGAMLALAHAAKHTKSVRGLLLVGCGSFDEASRATFQATVAARLDPRASKALRQLRQRIADPDERLAATARLLVPAYSCEPISHDIPLTHADARGHRETWRDMLRLQREGAYPRLFRGIACPAVMIHGACDPHPGRSVYETLRLSMPALEYVEIPRCGHYPWIEAHAASTFYSLVRDRIERYAMEGT